MNPKEKAGLIGKALSGEHLNGWLPGNDNKAARAHVVAGSACGWWGRVGTRAVYGAAGMVTWGEVIAIVARGCKVSGLRENYERAYAEWCAWAQAGGYLPATCDWPTEQQDDHYSWSCQIGEALHSAEAAIIEAGCTPEYEQEALF